MDNFVKFNFDARSLVGVNNGFHERFSTTSFTDTISTPDNHPRIICLSDHIHYVIDYSYSGGITLRYWKGVAEKPALFSNDIKDAIERLQAFIEADDFPIKTATMFFDSDFKYVFMEKVDTRFDKHYSFLSAPSPVNGTSLRMLAFDFDELKTKNTTSGVFVTKPVGSVYKMSLPYAFLLLSSMVVARYSKYQKFMDSGDDELKRAGLSLILGHTLARTTIGTDLFNTVLRKHTRYSVNMMLSELEKLTFARVPVEHLADINLASGFEELYDVIYADDPSSHNHKKTNVTYYDITKLYLKEMLVDIDEFIVQVCNLSARHISDANSELLFVVADDVGLAMLNMHGHLRSIGVNSEKFLFRLSKDTPSQTIVDFKEFIADLVGDLELTISIELV